MIRLLGFYLGLLLVGLSGAVGDVFLYRWGKERDASALLWGLGCWLICLVSFGLLIRFGERSLSRHVYPFRCFAYCRRRWLGRVSGTNAAING
ncbi:MAG: hypothetical protein R3C03_11465 [Pirellulaceae bacterium]